MSRALSLPKPHYGWIIVAVVACCYTFVVTAPGAALPMIYGPIIDEYGWSRAQVGAIASFKNLSGAILSLAGGLLIDRFGVRAVAGVAAAGTVAALLSFLMIHDLVSLYVIAFLLGGASLVTVVVLHVIVSRWFSNNLGVAAAIGTVGASVGGAVTPFLMTALLPTFGWRASMAILSVGAALIALPLILTFFKTPSSPLERQQAAAEIAEEKADIGAVLRTPTFWLFIVATYCVMFADHSMMHHLVLYLQRDVGFSALTAASALSMAFVGGFFGKLLFGAVFDRWSVYGIGFSYALLGLAALLISPWFVLGVPILLANTFRGLAHGGVVVDTPVAARHCFGSRSLGFVIGAWTAAGYLGSSSGPFIVGALYDSTGNYQSAFVIIVVVCFIAAACSVAAKPVYWSRARQAAKQPRAETTAAS